jgi:ABC-type multidrug transport system fused ATPase/permease subunit
MLSPILMNVYKDMVKGALFAPLTYFDNTPIAKVIHHLSSDLYLLDRIVLIEYFAFMGHLALAVGFITSIVFAYTLTEHFVLLGLFIVFLLVLFYKYSEYFGAVKAYRQAEDELKIPLNSYFSEIVQGQSIIRAFNKIS